LAANVHSKKADSAIAVLADVLPAAAAAAADSKVDQTETDLRAAKAAVVLAMALVGFSQGSMISLHVAPRRDDAVAGVIAFSGRLLEAESLADEALCHPPILLVHGDQDQVVPVQSLPEAAQALQDAGWDEVYAHVMKGTGHGIAPDGLSVALAFMQDKLGYA
jgi:predicted esterase